jgi:hypothetical protein
MTTYEYDRPTTASGKIASMHTANASGDDLPSLITASLQSCIFKIRCVGGVMNIIATEALSAPDKATLDGIVAGFTPVEED